MDREGNLWVGTDGDGLNRIKRKIFNTPAELHPWAAQSLSEDEHGGLWAAFNAHGLSYWITNSAQDFGVGRYSNAWTVLVDRQQQVWAGTRDEGLFQFQTNHFQPVPGAEILGPQIFALVRRSRTDSCGRAPRTVWRAGTDRTGKFTRRRMACRKCRSRHCGRCRRQSLGGNGKPGPEFFQGREIHFLSTSGKRLCPATTFPAFTWTRTAFCGSAPPVTAWRGFTREMDALFHATTASPATALVTSSKMTRAIYGLAPTRD